MFKKVSKLIAMNVATNWPITMAFMCAKDKQPNSFASRSAHSLPKQHLNHMECIAQAGLLCKIQIGMMHETARLVKDTTAPSWRFNSHVITL